MDEKLDERVSRLAMVGLLMRIEVLVGLHERYQELTRNDAPK